MKKSLIITIIVGVLLTALLVWMYFRDKKAPEQATLPPVTPPPAGNTTPQVDQGAFTQAANDDFPLQIGSKGDRVKSLQSKLNQIKPAGYQPLTVDGNFGQGTYNAVITWAGTTLYPVTPANYITIFNK
jgi:peptidoglycan hydrolase-like protein with peptidoglycan-binding domain